MMNLLCILLSFIVVINCTMHVLPGQEFGFAVEEIVPIAQLWTYNDVGFENNITGMLTWYEIGDGDCTDRIILVGAYMYPQIGEIVSCGAKAVLFSTSFYDVGLLGAQMKNQAVREQWSVLAFQMSHSKNEGWERLKDEIENGLEIEVMITPEGNFNIWEDAQVNRPELHVFQYILTGYSILTLLIAAEKLVFTLLGPPKSQKTLVILILVLETLANAFRAVYIAVDPVSSRGIFSVEFSFYGLQVTAPVSCLSTALLILYWFDALSTSGFFSKFKVIILVFLGLVFLVGTVILPFFFIFAISFTVLYVMLIFYIVIALILAIYIFYSAPGMFALIRRLKENRQPSFLWQARMVFISGIVLSLWALSTVGIFLGAKTLVGTYVTTYSWLALLTTVSLTQLLVFKPEITYIYGSTSGSTSKKGSQSQK